MKLGEVTAVDLAARMVETSHGVKYQGDIIALAAGSQPNFFGTPGADKHAFPLYSLQDAELLRSRILEVLESADRDPSLIEKGALNFVIVGAGPTGTEMAGALGDMIQRALKEEYRDLDLSKARVVLVDMVPSVLGAFSQSSQEYASKILKEHDVHTHLGVAVKEVTPDHVLLSDGARIPTRTVVWAGGLKASSLSANLSIAPGRGSRIDVQPDFSVKGFDNVYALGDFANIVGKDGKTLPQLASVAEQAGKYCAKNIATKLSGESGRPFDYFDKGVMAIIGRNAAVA
ncbi:FAD-dependent oxidoreductase [Granulicella sp. WH15]|uniref:NAD(P)/FAD-dependent oxidoreductase n=1 Tax=Granulicella sp. WH15 TaxID=2602070 RepID=UPI001C7092CC|nr:FAD-dependent oxidoreductase [Granulicella sp. WH15]